ncbi:hypothetical protein EMPG_13794 [Blastomyces silverae]|uniref:Transcriptional regulator n=1 Tax=Blastomyces silverae TaxID=2060906 RepID=A0A0H1BH87_9EURO|nr:hypothetical protein EMPG_13794 [Blastomyces silverae]
MSDSDSDSDSLSSAGIPSDDVLEKGLRDTVAAIFKKGNLEQLTVKRVRATTEKALTLDEGFYKNDEVWKAKSDRIIKQEAEKQEELAAEKEKKKMSSPAAPKPVPPPKPKAPKRASSASQPARKRRRTATPSESEEDLSSPPSEESEEEEEEDEEAPNSRKRARPAKKVSKPVRPAPKPKPALETDTSSDLSDVPDESEKASERASSRETSPMRKPSDTKHDESESDMSVVIDDEPPPKSKRRKSSEPSQQEKSKKSSKPASGASRKSKDAADEDPDLAEIKKLQGQLVKCGIRKMWFRELAPYDTPRAKVKHLRQMLKDAGMEGRFSLEKAKAIREARELQADLEVVREGAKRWGTKVSDEEEAGNGARPRRRVARGFQALSFLEDEDGEETD